MLCHSSNSIVNSMYIGVPVSHCTGGSSHQHRVDHLVRLRLLLMLGIKISKGESIIVTRLKVRLLALRSIVHGPMESQCSSCQGVPVVKVTFDNLFQTGSALSVSHCFTVVFDYLF